MAQLLAASGINTVSRAEQFLRPQLSVEDPFKLTNLGGGSTIGHAVDSNESVVIFGDYDVDEYDLVQLVSLCVPLGLETRYSFCALKKAVARVVKRLIVFWMGRCRICLLRWIAGQMHMGGNVAPAGCEGDHLLTIIKQKMVCRMIAWWLIRTCLMQPSLMKSLYCKPYF